MTITSMSKQQIQQAWEQQDLNFLGSVGKPFSTIEVAVMDVGDQRVPVGEIDDFCIANLARFKRPGKYLVAAELPKNATGKILKSKVGVLAQELVQGWLIPQKSRMLLLPL